jgi:septum formation protein
MNIILASSSEWRKRILSWLKVPFQVEISGVDEQLYAVEDPDELVCSLAIAKAEAVADRLGLREEVVVIGADTVIVVGEEIIGKPKDRENAALIMGKLQGRTHEVYTGVCVLSLETGEKLVKVEVTPIHFLPMNADQIDRYLDTGEWEGKAGAYQIMGAISPYVAEIEGSVTNVIGLPLRMTIEMLEHFEIHLPENVQRVVLENTGRTD